MSKGAIDAAVRVWVKAAVKAEAGVGTGCNNSGLEADAVNVALRRCAANGDSVAPALALAPATRWGDDGDDAPSCEPDGNHPASPIQY